MWFLPRRKHSQPLYIRAEDQSGDVYTNILTAKAQIVSIKFISLPRKELCGAKLLAELIDSTIVCSWLQKPRCRWTIFDFYWLISIVNLNRIRIFNISTAQPRAIPSFMILVPIQSKAIMLKHSSQKGSNKRIYSVR